MSESEPDVAGADLHRFTPGEAGMGTSRTADAGCTLAARLPPAIAPGGLGWGGVACAEAVRRAIRDESADRVGDADFGVICPSLVR